MSAIIVIEIVIGIVVLAAAVRFAVRDTRQRTAAVEPDVEPVETAQEPQHGGEAQVQHEPEPEAEQELSEVSPTERN